MLCFRIDISIWKFHDNKICNIHVITMTITKGKGICRKVFIEYLFNMLYPSIIIIFIFIFIWWIHQLFVSDESDFWFSKKKKIKKKRKTNKSVSNASIILPKFTTKICFLLQKEKLIPKNHNLFVSL